MILSMNKALNVYNNFAEQYKVAYLHPYYLKLQSESKHSSIPTFFVYIEEDFVYYHPFLLGRIPNTNYFDIQSVYGYGGPISTTNDSQFLINAWDSYYKWCREQSVIVEFIRFHPLLKNWNYYNGSVEKNRDTIWIDLTVGDLFKSYLPRTRTTIRKAISYGLIIEENKSDQNQEQFVELYYQTMKNLNASEFYFFSREYIKSVILWDNAKLLICRLNDEIIAGIIILINGNSLEYYLSASNSLGKRLGATSLLIHTAAEYGKGKGCHYLHLGGGSDSLENNTLFFFKSSFSVKRADYFIGSFFYNYDQYINIKKEWESNGFKTSEHILFYRDNKR